MNTQIYTEASEWLVEFRTEEVDQPMRRRFEKWISQSPEHVKAYLELTAVWETVSAQSRERPQDMDALIARAQTMPNVVALPAGEPSAPASNARRERQEDSLFLSRRGALAAAATLLVAVIGAGTYLYTQRNTYATSIGEQRSILLPDGSTIDLNARSKIRVELDESERHVDLLEGQALFHVAKDKKRPFIVAAGGTRVRAVGTEFDINQRKRGLIVTVVEGTVAVSSTATRSAVTTPVREEVQDPGAGVRTGVGPLAGSPTHRSAISQRAGEILLEAGQQVTVAAIISANAGNASVARPQPADIDIATAWTQRRLIFDSTPLQDVAEEFNRNNARPLVIEDEGLEDFHISGAFSSTDPQPLLHFLRTQSGIQVLEYRDRIVVARSG